MTMANGEQTYQFNVLTDLWTGDLNGKSGRLIPTGLLGSIRWWFEVLVRGLSGNACDPSDTKCEGRNHCVVCELFGCTGWARKFRFEVLNLNENTGQTLILSFTPLRPICVEEWTLLNATLRLIAGYGAIGGKTVFKPTDEPSREKKNTTEIMAWCRWSPPSNTVEQVVMTWENICPNGGSSITVSSPGLHWSISGA